MAVFCVLCSVSLIVMVIALSSGRAQRGEFVPPDFDSAAQSGVPEVTDESWTRIYQDGMSYSAHVCGRVVVLDGSADIYFANDLGNTVWMKLRILDEGGSILGETGLLKPDEYVKSIKFDSVPADGTKIKLKIMAYEPETYYSAGAVTLNTVIGGNDNS